MQVEVYDERELDSATLMPEHDAEALALIEELNLAEQISSTGVRLAYPKPTFDQSYVMEVLFPEGTVLDKYSAGLIPLRVLKEIKSYRSEYPDHTLVVRHAPPAIVSDPVLIAYTGNDTSYWYTTSRRPQWDKFRMVARWGDALESWDSLAKKAKAKFVDEVKDTIESLIAKLEVQRSLLSRGILTSKTTELPTLHWSGNNI